MSTNNAIRSARSIALIVAILCLAGSVPFAQTGTVAPVPRLQFLDNNGLPVASGKLYTYAAGTSTPLATYSDVNLLVANTNPIILNSSGRPSNGVSEVGVFLTAASYKFELQTSAGVTIWTQDNVSSVPPANVNLDVSGTAGEALSAGDLVYLCSGTGCATAGRWYKTDADFTYASTAASEWGVAVAAIASGSSGSIRLSGRVTGLSALNSGSDYFASATAGAITATPPTNALRVGRSDSTTSLILGSFVAPAGPRGPPCGRLTLTSGLPVTISDVTAATTLYYTPAGSCNGIDLYDGTSWRPYSFAEVSIAVPATTSQMYDVFAYDNAGVVALELTAWTNDTTRATALALQNGVYAKTGALTRRYLGSFRTTGVSGQTEDSAAKRYVWNYYNRADRSLAGSFVTGTYNYTTNTFQQFNTVATVQLDVVVGVAGEQLTAVASNWAYNGGATVTVQISIGEDSTTAAATGTIGGASQVGALQGLIVTLKKIPAVGRHFYAAIERSGAAGTTAWGPNANAMGAGGNAGIVGNWRS